MRRPGFSCPGSCNPRTTGFGPALAGHECSRGTVGQTWICLGLALAISNSCLHFSICACHHCAGAMVISSVSFQVCRMIPDGIRQHQRSHTSPSDHVLRLRPPPPPGGAVGRGGAPPLRLILSLSVRAAPSWPRPTLLTGAPPPCAAGAAAPSWPVPHARSSPCQSRKACSTVAILAQGTRRAVAVTQAFCFLGLGSSPGGAEKVPPPHFVQKSKRPRPTAGGIGGRVGATH